MEAEIREILTSVLQGRKRSASRSGCCIPDKVQWEAGWTPRSIWRFDALIISKEKIRQPNCVKKM